MCLASIHFVPLGSELFELAQAQTLSLFLSDMSQRNCFKGRVWCSPAFFAEPMYRWRLRSRQHEWRSWMASCFPMTHFNGVLQFKCCRTSNGVKTHCSGQVLRSYSNTSLQRRPVWKGGDGEAAFLACQKKKRQNEKPFFWISHRLFLVFPLQRDWPLKSNIVLFCK